MRNPKARIIPSCAKTGEGLDDFADWLLQGEKDWKN